MEIRSFSFSGPDGNGSCSDNPYLQTRAAAVAREICKTHTDPIDAGYPGSNGSLGACSGQALVLFAVGYKALLRRKGTADLAARIRSKGKMPAQQKCICQCRFCVPMNSMNSLNAVVSPPGGEDDRARWLDVSIRGLDPLIAIFETTHPTSRSGPEEAAQHRAPWMVPQHRRLVTCTKRCQTRRSQGLFLDGCIPLALRCCFIDCVGEGLCLDKAICRGWRPCDPLAYVLANEKDQGENNGSAEQMRGHGISWSPGSGLNLAQDPLGLGELVPHGLQLDCQGCETSVRRGIRGGSDVRDG